MITKNTKLTSLPWLSSTTYDPLEEIKAEIGRLIHAAVINKRFREMLLEDPRHSIETGYCGESFKFPLELTERIQNIRAKNLEDFSSLVLQTVNNPYMHELNIIHSHS